MCKGNVVAPLQFDISFFFLIKGDVGASKNNTFLTLKAGSKVVKMAIE